MSLVKMDVKVGESLEIGDVVAMRIENKWGQRVTLAIATSLTIRRNPAGIIPQRYIAGIEGPPTIIEPRIFEVAS